MRPPRLEDPGHQAGPAPGPRGAARFGARINALFSRGRGRLARWFPGPATAAAWAIPLLAYAAYALATATHLYHLRINVACDQAADVRVLFDTGQGFSEANAATAHVAPGAALQAVDVPLTADRLLGVRLAPLGGPLVMRVGALEVRTNFKIWARRQLCASFGLPALQADPRVIDALPHGESALRLAAADSAPAPACTVAFPAPLSLGLSWHYAGYRWCIFAAGWTALWILLPRLALVWVWLSAAHGRRWPAAGSVWLVALASGAISCFPVIFLGRSFVSTNFIDGPFLLYDAPSTLPGTANPQQVSFHGSDIFSMSNVISPYAMAEHEALFRDGELPLWNRYDEGGVALLGQGQSMLGDPLHALVIAANGRAWAWDAKFVLAKVLFAAGVGMLVLAATDCLPAALLLAFSAAFLGFFTYRLNHPAYFSFCYAPWILFAWTGLVRAGAWRPAMRWAGLLILANWMELNSGAAKEAFMLLAGLNATGALLLALDPQPWREKRRRLLGLAAAGVIFCLLAAPVLLSFWDTLRKGGSSYATPVAFQLQPSLLIGLFDDIFYRQFNPGEGVLDPSANALVLVGLLLAIGGAQRLLRDRVFAALALASAAPLALVFGVVPAGWIRQLPFLRNIYHIDNTFSCVLLIHFFPLAGFGFKRLLERRGRRWRSEALVALAAGALMVGAYFGAVSAQGRSGIAFAPSQPVLFSTFFCWYAPSVALAMLALPPLIRRLGAGSPTRAPLALLVCCLALLHWRFGVQLPSALGSHSLVLPERVDLLARSPAVDRLRRDAAAPFRVFGAGNVFAQGYGAMVGLETIIGLDALWNPHVAALDQAATRMAGASLTESDHPEHLAAEKPFHDLWGVRYYLTMPGQALPAGLPGVRLEDRLDLDIYRNDQAWPRAFFVDRLAAYHGADEFAARVISGDGRPVAEIDAAEAPALPGAAGRLPADQGGRKIVEATHYGITSQRTCFDVAAPSAGVIVLMEPFVDGDIVAEINGRPAPVWRVDEAFRGLLVDRPGNCRVVVSYALPGWRWALAASALGLLLAAAAGWWLWRDAAPDASLA